MKNAIVTLLTTLFISVMTLNASYGQDIVSPSAGDCTTIELVRTVTAEALKENEGTFEELSQADVAAYIQNVADELGTTPPWPIAKIILVLPKKDAEIMNIGYFDEKGCFITRAQLPVELVNHLLKRVKS